MFWGVRCCALYYVTFPLPPPQPPRTHILPKHLLLTSCMWWLWEWGQHLATLTPGSSVIITPSRRHSDGPWETKGAISGAGSRAAWL